MRCRTLIVNIGKMPISVIINIGVKQQKNMKNTFGDKKYYFPKTAKNSYTLPGLKSSEKIHKSQGSTLTLACWPEASENH